MQSWKPLSVIHALEAMKHVTFAVQGVKIYLNAAGGTILLLLNEQILNQHYGKSK